MSQSEPEATVKTLEEELGDSTLLQILLILTILILTIPIALGIDWLKKSWGYLTNHLSFRNISARFSSRKTGFIQ